MTHHGNYPHPIPQQQQRQPQHYMPPTQYVGPRYSVTYNRKRTAHLWHLVLTICTAGLWGALVWLPLVIIRSKKQKNITRYY